MRNLLYLFLAGATVAGFSSAACSDATDTIPAGSSTTTTTSSATGGGQGGAGGGATGSGGDIFNTGGYGPYSDFPEDPIIDSGLPADIATQFAAAQNSDSGGPCIAEPAMDAMVPRNWTPLLFEWTSPAEQGVYELTLDVENQAHPLVIYTTNLNYTIDETIWEGLTANSSGRDIQVRVRGAGFDGTSLTTDAFVGVTGTIHLAAVEAPGSVVYWTSSAGTAFQGFTIGDTTSKVILTPTSAGLTSTGSNTNCVSCHTSSPDGKLLFYSRDASDGTRAIDARNIDGTTVDSSTVSPAALTLLNRHKQTAPLTSAAHYSASDAIAITVMSDPAVNNGRYELVWTDLHAADASGAGVVPRNGDTRNVSSPAWSHDGTTLAYVSSAGGGEGVIAAATAADDTMDIYTVPYNNKQGGAATPLAGASDPNLREFYPVYSPNDTLLAFNRSDQPVSSYNQPSAEVFVMPAQGGTPTRLAANDPPMCTGVTSPGLTNSWARWAPKSEAHDGKNYYWLVFSSTRRAASNNFPQLYISAVVTEGDAGNETLVAQYPAIYVTAQNPLENNHTPAWDVFEVEDLPPTPN